MIKIGRVGILAMAFMVFLVGCGGETNNKEANPRGTEAEARAILEQTLDSWVFGDSPKEFEKQHPNIYFGDLGFAIQKKLGKYEIGKARKTTNTFEIQVTLNFPTTGGKYETVHKSYILVKAEGKWTIN